VHGMSNKDKRILQRVDEVCATLHTTRAAVLYALLHGVVAECLPDASGASGLPTADLRVPVALDVPRAGARELIMRAIQRHGSMTLRELKAWTTYRRFGIQEWESELQALIDGGQLEFHIGGLTRQKKIVSLAHK